MSATSTSRDDGGVGMLRIDLGESLCLRTVDPRLLSPFQRILLATDGTVTEILEAHAAEAIQVVKLFQECIETKAAVPYLNIETQAPVMIRKVMLRGNSSLRNYIYAESIVALDHLDGRILHGLMETSKPVGQLMLEARLETFREILSCCYEPAEEIGTYFDIARVDTLISRTYRIFANRQPFLLITEKFPATAFRDEGYG